MAGPNTEHRICRSRRQMPSNSGACEGGQICGIYIATMEAFTYKSGMLQAEDVSIADLVEEYGTPLYVYSRNHFVERLRSLQSAMAEVNPLVCYSVKANSNNAVIQTFLAEGAGLDIVSGGELFRALRAGADASKIVFAGVGKTREEIEYALREQILFFTVESEAEAVRISECSRKMNRTGRIAFRVNPDVDPKTHKYTTTGKKENKFGIDLEVSESMYVQAKNMSNLDVVGVGCHIGSQLTEVSPFLDTLKRLKLLIDRLRQQDIQIKYLDLGGGLGITYSEENPPHPSEYARALLEELGGFHCTLIFEPGRVIVGNAGILITRVLYTKKGPVKNFLVVDAGMNDLVRPSLYGSYHHIQPVVDRERPELLADVVGPICETGDFLARDRSLPQMEQGELLAVMSAGAYGFAMSSNYNSRLRPPEILVRGDRYELIRSRETYDDLLRGERIPDFDN